MEFRFITIWHIEAPLEAVCAAISDTLNWPQWWHNVERVEKLLPGDQLGVGSICRYTWRGRLPYRLTFDICVTHVEPLAVIVGVASGDVEGTGRWSFSTDKDVTIVRYDWQVCTTPAWMNLLALLARPIIEWNHHTVMQQGGIALAHMLNARLVKTAHY